MAHRVVGATWVKAHLELVRVDAGEVPRGAEESDKKAHNLVTRWVSVHAENLVDSVLHRLPRVGLIQWQTWRLATHPRFLDLPRQRGSALLASKTGTAYEGHASDTAHRRPFGRGAYHCPQQSCRQRLAPGPQTASTRQARIRSNARFKESRWTSPLDTGPSLRQGGGWTPTLRRSGSEGTMKRGPEIGPRQTPVRRTGSTANALGKRCTTGLGGGDMGDAPDPRQTS